MEPAVVDGPDAPPPSTNPGSQTRSDARPPATAVTWTPPYRPSPSLSGGNPSSESMRTELDQERLDLKWILQSSQTISSILNIDQLLSTTCEILLTSYGILAPQLVAVVVEQDVPGRWCVAASGTSTSGVTTHMPTLPLDKASFVAGNVVSHCRQTYDALLLPNIICAGSSYSPVSEAWSVLNPGGKSVISLPIVHGGNSAMGVLYLEGEPSAFTERHLSVLQLLIKQIGISYSNALSFMAVEQASTLTASMLDAQRKALAQAEEAETKAKISAAEALRSVQHAEEAAKARSRVLANVSHELRTPLNGVIGNSELLRASGLTPDQADKADSIRISADLLLTVINDILDFSKIENDKMQLFITAFSPRELLKEIVRSVSYSNSRNVAVVEDIDIPSSLVFGDPVRVHQVLGNLLGNSMKFTDEGTITIGAKVKEETLEHLELTFWVQDTGIGIPPAQLKKLFKPFSQADASTARKYGGSGLGLSICKSLIEAMMQGQIELDSVEGEGTTAWFTVRFPKAGKETSEGDCPEPEDERGRLQSHVVDEPMLDYPSYNDFSHVHRQDVRIAIAEDNPINQKIALQFCQKLGFSHVDTYDNGKMVVEGLRHKAQQGTPYHLLLCDVQMPILDGYEATMQIRKESDPAVSGILIIAMTASAIQGDREKCLESGMNDYLAKPVRVQVLKQKLEQYIQKPSTENSPDGDIIPTESKRRPLSRHSSPSRRSIPHEHVKAETRSTAIMSATASTRAANGTDTADAKENIPLPPPNTKPSTTSFSFLKNTNSSKPSGGEAPAVDAVRATCARRG